MAHIRKRGDKWGVCIRRLGVSEFKSFDSLEDAERWADIEEKAIVLENERRRHKPRDDERQLEFASSSEIVVSGIRFHNGPGVYVLLEREAVTYVGKARNAIARVLSHSKNGRRFTHYVIIPCEQSRLSALEEKMIRRLRPTENKALPQDRPNVPKSRASAGDVFLSGGRDTASVVRLSEHGAERKRTEYAVAGPNSVPNSAPCQLSRSEARPGESRSECGA